MERTMSVEEKIKRAEEIYRKRRQGSERQIATVDLNESKKEIKLLKKMIMQILVCTVIYFIFSTIYNNNYIFSEDFTSKAKELLSYDMNFSEIYENIKSKLEGITKNSEKQEDKKKIEKENENQQEKNYNVQENNEEKKQESIGGAENVIQFNETQQLSQIEQDINDVKNITTFIKPIEGVVSSQYGIRETATGNVPKNHTGTDIAANIGTKIKASTDGEVVLVSEEGDYGKHIKIQIGEVSVIYAHCNCIYVKQGDKVLQGQEIAEVGTTGNSTGPHLHLEIRIYERTVDPQKILEL